MLLEDHFGTVYYNPREIAELIFKDAAQRIEEVAA